MSTTDLDARYGRTGDRRRRLRLLATAAAAAVAVALVGWVLWAGPLAPGASIEAREIGFTTPSEGRLELRFSVSVDPGETVACALEAQNEQHAVVGWKVVELPPSERRTRHLEELVLTSEHADTGLISRCWLT